MMTSTIERKQCLVRRARMYYHTGIYLPDTKQYVRGLSHEPKGVTSYRNKEIEPVVDTEALYNIDRDDTWLTVNHYNALVLNTRNMLIADIDFGDQRLNRFAGAKDCDEVLGNLKDLHLLDNEHQFADFNFASQSYRIYRTHSGCRVICTSLALPWGWEAERFMRFLRSDPEYIKLCGIQECYRARLTPKPWRGCGEPVSVCVLEGIHGKEKVAYELTEQLRLHDELTLGEDGWTHLA